MNYACRITAAHAERTDVSYYCYYSRIVFIAYIFPLCCASVTQIIRFFKSWFILYCKPRARTISNNQNIICSDFSLRPNWSRDEYVCYIIGIMAARVFIDRHITRPIKTKYPTAVCSATSTVFYLFIFSFSFSFLYDNIIDRNHTLAYSQTPNAPFSIVPEVNECLTYIVISRRRYYYTA